MHMDQQTVIEALLEHRAVLSERFGVKDLALFGSFARNQAKDSSDVDILVNFVGPATSKAFFGVQFYLEDLLGRRVDLVTSKALRPEFRTQVAREAMYV